MFDGWNSSSRDREGGGRKEWPLIWHGTICIIEALNWTDLLSWTRLRRPWETKKARNEERNVCVCVCVPSPSWHDLYNWNVWSWMMKSDGLIYYRPSDEKLIWFFFLSVVFWIRSVETFSSKWNGSRMGLLDNQITSDHFSLLLKKEEGGGGPLLHFHLSLLPPPFFWHICFSFPFFFFSFFSCFSQSQRRKRRRRRRKRRKIFSVLDLDAEIEISVPLQWRWHILFFPYCNFWLIPLVSISFYIQISTW